MKLSDTFFPDGEHVKCDCGVVFVHSPVKWKVLCPNCKAWSNLHSLRYEWRIRQPNAASDDAMRDALLTRIKKGPVAGSVPALD